MSVAQASGPPLRTRTVDALVDCLGSEARLLDQLGGILRDQREGVAGSDVSRVDRSVHAAHRVLQTLAEARRRRYALVHVLTTRSDIPVAGLSDALGLEATPALRDGQAAVEARARTLSREVSLNRAVLTAAIQTGNEYVRQLVAPAAATYGENGQWTRGADAPALLNRKV